MSDGGFYERVGTGRDGEGLLSQVRSQREIASIDRLQTAEPPNHQPLYAGHGNIKRWAQRNDAFWQANDTVDKLSPGFYRFDTMPNIGACVIKTRLTTDNLIRLPDTATADVLAEFAQFWTLGDRFAKRGFTFKRGILLWGPPGSGKTSGLMQMAADIINDYEGIVCQIAEPATAAFCLQLIRNIEPDRPIVALMEDLDALVQTYGENQFLSLLDGEAQVDKIAFVATTNYPERLDKRFVDRPSRFDTVRWVGMPSAAARRRYLEVKEPDLTPEELTQWVKETEGFSVAHLRELVILVKCFDRPLSDAIARLERMRVRPPSSEEAPDRPGFGIFGAKR